MTRITPVEDSFIALLMEDVIEIMDLQASNDTQANRRHLVRAIFAAIEGTFWICREHVRESAKSMGYLTPLADLALREQSFGITEKGKVIERTRYVPFPTAVHLVVDQAKLLVLSLDVDFNDAGWSRLKAAIRIRNRATHPKDREDIVISDIDLKAITDGLFWILGLTEKIMSAVNAEFTDFNEKSREFFQLLQAGDPAALALYRSTLQAMPDD